MEQQEALHLEPDVRVDDDAKPVEDAGAGRVEVAVLDGEPVLDDARGDRGPEANQVVGWQVANAGAGDFVAADNLHAHSLSLIPDP